MANSIDAKKKSIIACLEQELPGIQFNVTEDVGFFFHSNSPRVKRALAISDLAMGRFEINVMESKIKRLAEEMTKTSDKEEFVWLYSHSE